MNGFGEIIRPIKSYVMPLWNNQDLKIKQTKLKTPLILETIKKQRLCYKAKQRSET